MSRLWIDRPVQAFLQHFRRQLGLEVTMLSYGAAMLYYEFGKKKMADRLVMP